jgi:hypothetical protein
VKVQAGDQKVVLQWGRDSEKDPLFEGYRIYRSEDGGATWSSSYATDENGTPMVPVPLDQYDLDNEYSGVSPENPLFYFGSNTGLNAIMKVVDGDTIYEWTDNTVINNYTYRYWVSAYSHGDSLHEPLETPPENDPSLADDNTVEATPTAPLATSSLDKIQVVPNPYKVTAPWETDIGIHKIAFTGLPAKCAIRIYNVSGDLVKSIEHNDGTSYSYWNLHNNQDQEVAPGLYFYHVDAGEIGNKIGKFVIIL